MFTQLPQLVGEGVLALLLLQRPILPLLARTARPAILLLHAFIIIGLLNLEYIRIILLSAALTLFTTDSIAAVLCFGLSVESLEHLVLVKKMGLG